VSAQTRDPRRSLILGTIIAAVVLLIVLVIVVAGLLKVFLPRSSDPEGLRPIPPASLAIHPERTLDS
jgi:hypothetical protein